MAGECRLPGHRFLQLDSGLVQSEAERRRRHRLARGERPAQSSGRARPDSQRRGGPILPRADGPDGPPRLRPAVRHESDMQCGSGPGDVTCSTTTATHPQIALDSRENAFAIQVRLRKTSVPGVTGCSNAPDDEYGNDCRWFYTAAYVDQNVPPTAARVLGAPVHRSFMGHLERTGPIKWLRLTVDHDCDVLGLTLDDRVIGHDYFTPGFARMPRASWSETIRCYVVDLGMAGGLAQTRPTSDRLQPWRQLEPTCVRRLRPGHLEHQVRRS